MRKVQGRHDDANEPARHAHCDMVLESLRDTLSMCRRDISEAAKPSAEAEEMRKNGSEVKVPRYAAYSIWVLPSTYKVHCRTNLLTYSPASIEKSQA